MCRSLSNGMMPAEANCSTTRPSFAPAWIIAMPLRFALAAALLPVLLVIPVLAKSRQILSSGGTCSAAAIPGADNPALCKQIVAKQNRSKQAMADAADLYFHGTLM